MVLVGGAGLPTLGTPPPHTLQLTPPPPPNCPQPAPQVLTDSWGGVPVVVAPPRVFSEPAARISIKDRYSERAYEAGSWYAEALGSGKFDTTSAW